MLGPILDTGVELEDKTYAYIVEFIHQCGSTKMQVMWL